MSEGPGAQGARTQVTCAKCNKTTTVPFTPTPGRPVFCRDCFQKRMPARSGPGGRFDSRPRNVTERKRMLAQGRKTHFLHDAREVLDRMEGGMDETHQRAFLEGLFARGARTSTEAAQVFLDEKVGEKVITEAQREALGRLLERYSFRR